MKKQLYSLFLIFAAAILLCQPILALSDEQRALYDSGVYYFDIEDGQGTARCTDAFVGGNNQQVVWNYLKSKGFTDEQAAGLMGNFQVESGFDPTAVNSSSGATGLVQWLGGRLDQLRDFAEVQELDMLSLETQLQYMWFEMAGEPEVSGLSGGLESAAYDAITGTSTIKEATLIVRTRYERPGEHEANDADRLKAAEAAFSTFAGSSPSSNTTGSSSNCTGTAVDINGFNFPLIANQTIIKGGVDGVQQSEGHGGLDEWCWAAKTNCHHDYNAADLHAPVGTEVVAVKPGTVVKATDQRGGVGTRVAIKGDDGLVYYYAHMAFKSLLVESGNTVRAGQPLGAVGESSQADDTAPHLHFDVLPENYNSRVSCGGDGCTQYPFIDIQPVLANLFNNLPE